MATAVSNLSLEEFLVMPGATFHDFHELHNGEIVEVPSPTVEHIQIQKRIERLLDERCNAADHLAMREFYMTLGAEARRVDVALIGTARFNAHPKKVFYGSPELVVEVLSPSNLAMDLDHLRETCFKDECLEFWVVNQEFQTVTVYRRDRSVKLYFPGDSLSLEAFGIAATIPVSQIFQTAS